MKDDLQEMMRQTHNGLDTLPEALRNFVELRFGISGRPRHSVRRLASVLGVKPARVRAAEVHVLAALRHPTRKIFEALGLEALRVNRDPAPAIADAIESVEQLTPELIAHLQTRNDDLRKIPWMVFEHLVAECLGQQGFRDVRLVGRDPRTSADLYATWVVGPIGSPIRFFIEVKRWRERVGITVINEVVGAMFTERERFGWHVAMIVAVGGFARFEKYSHLELSLRGVELKQKSDLLSWLRGYRPNANGLWLPAPLEKMPEPGLGELSHDESSGSHQRRAGRAARSVVRR